jgi:hypothetical protein
MRLRGEAGRQLQSALDEHDRSEEPARPVDGLLEGPHGPGVAEVRAEVVEEVHGALLRRLLDEPRERGGGGLGVLHELIREPARGEAAKRGPVTNLDLHVRRRRGLLADLGFVVGVDDDQRVRSVEFAAEDLGERSGGGGGHGAAAG